MEAAAARFLELAAGGKRHRARETVDGWDAWIEGDLVGGARGAAAAALQAFGRDPARMREYTLLSWQTERLFPVLLPLAGAAFYKDGVLHSHYHAARWTEHDGTLADALERRDARCDELVEALGRETARLHSLRGRHAGLLPRRLLVARPGALQPLVWCGAGRGSVRLARPGPLDDLAPAVAHLREAARADLVSILLDSYRAERGTQSTTRRGPGF